VLILLGVLVFVAAFSDGVILGVPPAARFGCWFVLLGFAVFVSGLLITIVAKFRGTY